MTGRKKNPEPVDITIGELQRQFTDNGLPPFEPGDLVKYRGRGGEIRYGIISSINSEGTWDDGETVRGPLTTEISIRHYESTYRDELTKTTDTMYGGDYAYIWRVSRLEFKRGVLPVVKAAEEALQRRIDSIKKDSEEVHAAVAELASAVGLSLEEE